MENPTRTILIVDDSPDDRVAFRWNLEKTQCKYLFFEAETGARALELCRLEKFDCILLDLKLPDMDGAEVLQKLAFEHGANAFPVIAVSGSDSIEDALLMLKNGAHEYLFKSNIMWTTLGRAVDNAIEKVGFYHQKKQDETEIYRLASIVESSEDAIISKNFSGIILSWNKGAQKMFGYTSDEIIGQNITVLFPPELLPEEEKIIAKIKSGGHLQHYETIRRRKDGSDIEISLTVSPIKNRAGEIVGISKIAREITRQKQVARSLRESEANFRALTEATSQAVWESSESGRNETINQWWSDLTGLELGEKRNWLEALHPDDREKASLAWANALKRKTLFAVEYRIRNKNGEYQHYEVRGVPVFNDDGSFRQWIGTFGDITERKDAEEKLRESKYRMLLATEATGVGIWEWNVITNKIRWDDQMFRIYGIAPTEDGYLPYSDWSESVLPEDLSQQEEILQDTVRRFGHSSRQFRIQRRDNLEYRDIQSVETVRTNALGAAEWVVGTNLDITERKRAGEALRLEKERLEKTATASPNAIFSFRLSPDGEMSLPYSSPVIKEIYGFTPEELKDDCSVIFARIHPEEAERGQAAIKESATNMSLFHETNRYQHPQKGELWIEVSSAPTLEPDGSVVWHGVISDVTKRIRVEEALREASRFNEQIINNVQEGIIVLDKNLRYVVWNKFLENLTNLKAENLIGKTPFEAAPELCENGDYKHVERALTGETIRSIDNQIKMSTTGRSHWVSSSFSPHYASNSEISGVIVTVSDIGERKKSEHEIIRLNQSLEQKVAERTAELNAVNKELEAFSYSVSHDLRAPLRAMDGFSLALLEDYADKLDATGQNYLNRVRNASKQMARLIDDMLLLSRVTRGEIIKTEVNLSELAYSIADKLIENQPRESIIFEIEPGVQVYGDERLLRIALENLLGNAYKFTSKRDNAKIIFGQAKNGSGIEYFVKDNGAGFDMAYSKKLFGAFQRLHGATEFEGTGIGLATVQRVIRRHGGRIRAEGKVGEGAGFYFTL